MKRCLLIILVLSIVFTPLILINSLSNHEKLQEKIKKETGYPFVFIEKYTLKGRSFTAYIVNPKIPHIPEIVWVEGYVGWFGRVHVTRIIDYEFQDGIA